MKVLLISHPNRYRQKPDFPPIGTAYLGAVAYENGYETLLIDGGLTNFSDIIIQAKDFSPQFIGVTCWTINRGMVWQLCLSLKKVLPNSFLAIGGPHATYLPEQIFVKTHASAIVIGEGEETFKELLIAVDQNKDMRHVNGIIFRGENDKLYRTETRQPIDNLDSISKPYYHGFKHFSLNNYSGFAALPRPTAAIITSRGCVFNCTYCGSVNFWGKRWRYRSATNVLDEIEILVRDLGAKSLYIFDDNFTVNKQRVIDICEGILERRLGIKWSCCSHVKMINSEILALMKKSGCVSIDFGVESGSDKILRNINKHQTRKDIEEAFTLVHSLGIKPRSYLMVGNMGEDESTINETIELIGHIKPWSSIGATILWLLPGTTVYNEAVKNGFMSEDYWLKSDDIPYNLQEYTYEELFRLRQRLMIGIAKNRGGISPLINYYLKNIFYKYPFLAFFRSLIPNKFR